MSYVTTVVLFAPYTPEATKNALLDGYEQPDGRRVKFGELTSYPEGWSLWGGSKGPEADVFGGGFNFLDEDALKDWLGSLKWLDRIGVMLETNGESGLRVWTLDAGLDGKSREWEVR